MHEVERPLVIGPGYQLKRSQWPLGEHALGAARQIEAQTAIHAVYTLMIEMVTRQPQTGVDLPEPGLWRLLEDSLDRFDHAHAKPIGRR